MAVKGFSLTNGTCMGVMEYRYHEWSAPSLMDRAEIRIHPMAQVLHYAGSLFEGMKAFRTIDDRIVLFRPDMNAARMHRGASRLGMPPVPEHRFLELVRRVVRANQEFVPPCGEGALYIRPTLIASGPVLGLSLPDEYLFLVMVDQVGDYFADASSGVYLWYEPTWNRIAEGASGDIKYSGNYGYGIHRKLMAQKRGCAEVLYSDPQGRSFTECSAMNMFFRRGDDLFTRKLDDLILPGITRDSVIQIARHHGIRVIDNDVVPVDFRAEEAFGTGTAAVITPVAGWRASDDGGITYSEVPGYMGRMLKQHLTDIQYGRAEDHFGWVVAV